MNPNVLRIYCLIVPFHSSPVCRNCKQGDRHATNFITAHRHDKRSSSTALQRHSHQNGRCTQHLANNGTVAGRSRSLSRFQWRPQQRPLYGRAARIDCLAAAGENSCDYCASAHTALGTMAGLDQDEMRLIIEGGDLPSSAGAIVAMARNIVKQRGVISDHQIAAFYQGGFDEGQLVELIAVVTMNIFTNYFNHIAATEIDFPVVSTKAA
ncbi:MAG: carboxymuconolactone decarboxylase family protein [Sphingopyxis sp.]|nr:carboxymuconolactone decarboxylase family protein [Sphingopyxis sp.]